MASGHTTSTFLTSILSQISTAIPNPPQSATDSPPNPLSTLPLDARNLLLTLHVLYPTQFLPALDILDRNLLTRLLPPQESTLHAPSFAPLYLVRSSSTTTTSSSRFHDALAPTAYEVRTKAWNCSCPAFAFAAFPPEDPPLYDGDASWDVQSEELGAMLRDRRAEASLPMCKHLLACVLVERVQAFAVYVDERRVSGEEIAGWAAGWGG
jgi:hypothetical protein